MKKKVGVFFGGRSVEHEVSVITGMQIIENIDKTKYEVVPVYIDKEGKWYTGEALMNFKNFKNNNLKNLKEVILTPVYNDNKIYSHPETIGFLGKKLVEDIDVIFPALHGTNGEDGSLQGVFELLNLPYVGGGVLASSVGMDKILMKDVFKSYNLPIVDYMWFFRKRWYSEKDSIINEIESKLGYPVFVKPANLGSSVGISKAKDREKLIDAIEIAIRYDRKIIVEQSIENPREINCAVIGYEDKVKASLCEEPVGWKDLLTYEDKYVNSNTKGSKIGGRNIPADLPADITEKIQDLAKKAFMSIDCRGNARIDFLLDDAGNVYVNEINTLPGSIAYYLWEPMGISFKELITEMLEIAIEAHKEKNENMYSYDVDLFKRIEFGGKAKKV
ncbi:D-alanine--D-alanine ligase family protein [Brassicibacter mesophilus]|uniref:D-alanine--D-alanine ligase family protein n=1 Tax=Brassicibacter mesophilus TaxID=745119 RepID=UPI003D22B2A6